MLVRHLIEFSHGKNEFQFIVWLITTPFHDHSMFEAKWCHFPSSHRVVNGLHCMCARNASLHHVTLSILSDRTVMHCHLSLFASHHFLFGFNSQGFFTTSFFVCSQFHLYHSWSILSTFSSFSLLPFTCVEMLFNFHWMFINAVKILFSWKRIKKN